jgi:hypothetical protein
MRGADVLTGRFPLQPHNHHRELDSLLFSHIPSIYFFVLAQIQ